MGAGKDHGDVCAVATNAANAVGAELSGQPYRLDESGAVVNVATFDEAEAVAADYDEPASEEGLEALDALLKNPPIVVDAKGDETPVKVEKPAARTAPKKRAAKK